MAAGIPSALHEAPRGATLAGWEVEAAHPGISCHGVPRISGLGAHRDDSTPEDEGACEGSCQVWGNKSSGNGAGHCSQQHQAKGWDDDCIRGLWKDVRVRTAFTQDAVLHTVKHSILT